jgi:hypothetical protein
MAVAWGLRRLACTQRRWRGLRGGGEGDLICPRAIQVCNEVCEVMANVFGLSVSREVAEKSGNACDMVALQCVATPTRWMPSAAPEALFLHQWVRCVSLSEA